MFTVLGFITTEAPREDLCSMFANPVVVCSTGRRPSSLILGEVAGALFVDFPDRVALRDDGFVPGLRSGTRMPAKWGIWRRSLMAAVGRAVIIGWMEKGERRGIDVCWYLNQVVIKVETKISCLNRLLHLR